MVSSGYDLLELEFTFPTDLSFLFPLISHELLDALAFGRRIVRAVALQKIDYAPHAKASAEGNHKGLQSGDGRSEKLHIFLRFSGVKAPAMKKAALAGGSLLTGFYTRFLFCGRGSW